MGRNREGAEDCKPPKNPKHGAVYELHWEALSCSPSPTAARRYDQSTRSFSSSQRTAPAVSLSITGQRSAGTGRIPVRHWLTVGAATPSALAAATVPPRRSQALFIAACVFIERQNKALPNRLSIGIALRGFGSQVSCVPNSSERHLGHKLAEAIRIKGVLQSEVAGFFKVSKPTVSSDWLKHGRIAKKHYPKLVEFFELPYEWWFGAAKRDQLREQLLMLYAGISLDARHELVRQANLIYAREHPGDRGADPFAGVDMPDPKPKPLGAGKRWKK